MVVFTGLPGTGKTTLAEAAARAFGWLVFTKDRLEAALWRSGLTRETASG